MPIEKISKPLPDISYPASNGSGEVGPLWEDVSTEFTSRSVALMIYGDTDCLSGDTFLNYQVRNEDGKIQDSKGGTLERLYERFHKIKVPGRGLGHRAKSYNSKFYIASVKDSGALTINLIENVVYCGVKTVYRVVVESGDEIVSTLGHRFLTPTGHYELLDNLSIDDFVMVNPGVAKKRSTSKANRYRPEVTVKYHPTANMRINKRLKGDVIRYRMPYPNAVYEAYQNGMKLWDYINFLDDSPKEIIDRLWVMPKGSELHHIDGNHLNNDPKNLLLVIDRSTHIKEHHIEQSTEHLAIYVEPQKIVSIDEAGEEDTYDIVCAEPFRNFVANRFAVHNSGRSTLALTAPGPIAYIHSYEKVDGLINESRKSKLIRASKFGGDLRGPSDRVQELAEIQVRKMEAAISDAYSWARSIIVDTESKAWEIHQLARLGSLERADNSLTEKEKKKGQLIYQGINNRWASMLQEYRVRAEKPLQDKPTNLILICKTVDEYEGNKATGRTIFKCQKDTPFFVDVRVRTKVKISQFSVTVEKPWWNAEMRGFELTGGKEVLTIPNIMSLITLTDKSEWE